MSITFASRYIKYKIMFIGIKMTCQYLLLDDQT